MHQDLLYSIAGRRIVHLGVNADLASHVNITVRVNIDVADAVGMAQHGNLGVLLDMGHQRVAASWDDQVNDIVQLQKLIHVCSGRDETDDISANLQNNFACLSQATLRKATLSKAILSKGNSEQGNSGQGKCEQGSPEPGNSEQGTSRERHLKQCNLMQGYLAHPACTANMYLLWCSMLDLILHHSSHRLQASALPYQNNRANVMCEIQIVCRYAAF